MPRTLDYWKHRLTSIPSNIDCPDMSLKSSSDHAPPVFTGSGQIYIKSSTSIEFTMYAQPTDVDDAFQRLVRSQNNPYDTRDQFRLVAIDYEGTEWTCGWTCPDFKGPTKVCWPLTGSLNSLSVAVSGPHVSIESGVELVFKPKFLLPMEEKMVTTVSVGDDEIEYCRSPGRHSLEILGTEIDFSYTPSDDNLWVTAKTSDKLQHPYAENWLSEPLRILLGQHVYPRLVARNFGDGRATVWLRPSPRHFHDSGIASLFGESPLGAGAEFWGLYAGLLTMVVEARDAEGGPNFESHRITRYYEEISQATQGSRWILCMTLASVGEGLAKMLMHPNEQRSDISQDAIDSIKDTVKKWEGDAVLRNRVLNDIERTCQRSIGMYLRDLVKRGVLDKKNAKAWSDVRHAVMHGNLVSPWPTEDADKRITDLADLVHRLTSEIINKDTKSNSGVAV